MFKIVKRKPLRSTLTMLEIEAPLIANKALPGQFVILRVDDRGERIPLTISGVDKNKETVRVIFQIVGATTTKLNHIPEGGFLQDFVGPLGNPTVTEGIRKVCIVGGGVGSAIALPLAEEFHRIGAYVTSIIGFRNKDLVILEDEFKAVSDRMYVMTDDGTYGRKGNCTVPLRELLASEKFDNIFCIGPIVMMKFTVLAAKEYDAPITVSMCPIMIDGTGMCGGCRVILNQNGKSVTKFACVDGPDFNGYEVDFDNALMRSRMYADYEKHAYEEACNLFKDA